MFARSLRIAAAVGLLMVLASCTLLHGRSIDRPLVYYVRNVTVMADARIPLDLIESVDRRVSSAIAATRAPAGAERVVLLVKIDHLGFGEGARRRLAQAKFMVTATSVETGEPVAQGFFTVNSPTDDPRWTRQALAEEIAARIRFAFSLTTPRIRKSQPPRTISTRLVSDPAPVIVPRLPHSRRVVRLTSGPAHLWSREQAARSVCGPTVIRPSRRIAPRPHDRPLGRDDAAARRSRD